MTSEHKPAGGPSRSGKGPMRSNGKSGNAGSRFGGQGRKGNGKGSTRTEGKRSDTPYGRQDRGGSGKPYGKPGGKPSGKPYGKGDGRGRSSFDRDSQSSRFERKSDRFEKGGRPSYDPRDERSSAPRDGKPYRERSGKPYGDRSGKFSNDRARKPFGDRNSKPSRKGEGKPYPKRDGEHFDKRRDGKPFAKNDRASSYRADGSSSADRRGGKPFDHRADAALDNRDSAFVSHEVPETSSNASQGESDYRGDRHETGGLSYKPRSTFKNRGPRVDETGRMVGYGRIVNREAGKKRVERYERLEKVDRLYAGRQQESQKSRYVTVPSDSEEFDYRSLEAGDRVVHVAYGEGRVERRMGNKLAVMFGTQKRWFMVPLVFDNGDLRLWSEDEPDADAQPETPLSAEPTEEASLQSCGCADEEPEAADTQDQAVSSTVVGTESGEGADAENLVDLTDEEPVA